MSDQVGNQNVGFLMTRLNFLYLSATEKFTKIRVHFTYANDVTSSDIDTAVVTSDIVQFRVYLGDNCIKFFIWGGISSDIRSEKP